MLITVKRETLSPTCAGTMAIDGQPFGFTLELPWLDNKPRESAIPAGKYRIQITPSNRFKKMMLQIMDVPGRAGIRIHNANFATELLGCIAVGRKRYNEEHIGVGLAHVLMEKVAQAIDRGEVVTLEIENPGAAA